MPARVFVLVFALCLTVVGLMTHYARDIYHYSVYGVADLSFADNARRVSLIRAAVNNPRSLETMTAKEFDLLFRDAEITRVEADVTARHYQSGTCAIDVYFSDRHEKPDYVEFRTLSLNTDVQTRFEGNAVNLSCLKDVLQARGVDTPENYAAQPVPSWDSPYSS